MTSRHFAASALALSVAAALCPAAHAQPAAAASDTTVHPELWPQAKSVGLIDAGTEARVSQLMAQMSLEEKVGQTIQGDITSVTPEDLRTYPLGSILAGGNSGPGGNDRAPAQAWLDMVRAFQAVATERRAGHTPIPLMVGIDAVHGNNNIKGATIFPHNVGLGAMRDPGLMRRIGEATAQEVAVIGFDWSFGPTLTVPRDDRWGRAFEGYSEDPEIVRAYAGEMVLGLQGPPGSPTLKTGHVAASAKHFLADGGTEGGRDQGDAKASEAELIGLHAQGYPAAINAGTLTVMASFSSWRGQKMTGNRDLLTGVLKGRMGFDGLVVGDWNAHGQVPGCTNESCAAAMNAGLDMFMAPDSWKGLYRNTLAQVRSGQIPMARLDDAVRRILRVKLKEGLFDPARPLDGRFERLGAPEHRAVARQAVAESLVLLKNQGVLPIKGSARVLVAGDGADNIGKQSGGWTLSWQGSDNKNSDFPNGQSIFGGIQEALKASGGEAELSVDGAFTRKPDVAVVVFGENPYAEFQGDVPNLDYQAGDRRDLALVKKLKSRGIPVVSVFLSGRPLWVNPEINASDAFVAAWLPGSEGGGVADVLVGDAAGKPRHDFRGRLSFSWPRTATQIVNRGDTPYDPQFAYGYGLSYASPAKTPQLSEAGGAPKPTGSTDVYFAKGRPPAPWTMSLRDHSGEAQAGAGPADSPDHVVASRPVDAGAQEAGRGFVFNGSGLGEVTISGPPIDLGRQTTGDMAIALRLRVDAAPSAPVSMGVGCGGACRGAVDITPLLSASGAGEWRTVKIKLSCFKAAGADVSRISTPLNLSTAGRLSVSLADVRLATNVGDAICPAAAPAG